MLEYRMPQFGMGMTDGTIVAWLKAEGDRVAAGEPLVEIEAAKTTMEAPAPADGVLRRILLPVGENAAVNTPIALIEEGATASPPAETAALREDADVPPEAPSTAPKATPSTPHAAERNGADLGAGQGVGSGGEVASAGVPRMAADGARPLQIEPRASRAAKDLGVRLEDVRGSGPNGRIVEADVRAFATRGAAAELELPKPPPAPTPKPAPAAIPEGVRSTPHSAMRRTIAARLTQSKSSVPHFYLKASCTVDALLELRRQINDGDPTLKVSLNDLLVRAVGLALRRVPAANVSWTEAAMLHHESVDVAVAVATPKGLVTPVCRDVDRRPIGVLSDDIRALAARGREGKLRPEEYEGGSASVSNLGMYGVEEFSAILNPPQASIFAIGAAEPRPTVRDGAVVVATQMTVTLSVDHRAVDGAVAAELLAAFKSLVERPALILA